MGTNSLYIAIRVTFRVAKLVDDAFLQFVDSGCKLTSQRVLIATGGIDTDHSVIESILKVLNLMDIAQRTTEVR